MLKKIITLLIFMLTSSISFTYAQTDALRIEKLSAGLYVYTTYMTYNGVKTSSNAMYMVTKDGVVLFDTPWDPNQNQPLIDSIASRHQQKIIAVYATHSHEDRAGGFGFFNEKGIPTYATLATNIILKKEKKPLASHLITLDQPVTVGGAKFVIKYFGQGHTSDNVVVWFPEQKVLHGGCLVKSTEARSLGFTGEANLQKWPETIKRIQQSFKEINWVIPGHDDWKKQGHLENTIQLLQQ